MILALCEKFGKSGQSGGSAPYTATAISQAIKSLLLQEPICPITGINEEWSDVTEMSVGKELLYQNKRCGPLFKDPKGSWYLDAIVWKDQEGSCWGGSAQTEDGKFIYARQFIKEFPFTPKTFYIDVVGKEVKPDGWEFYIKDPEQLDRVWKYYKKPIDL